MISQLSIQPQLCDITTHNNVLVKNVRSNISVGVRYEELNCEVTELPGVS